MYCKECGKLLEEDARFCSQCGCRVAAAVTQEQERNVPEFEAVWEMPQGDGKEAEDQEQAGEKPEEGKKKKRILPRIILGLVIFIILAVIGLFVYFSFIDQQSDKGIFEIFDLTDGGKTKLKEEQEEAFLALLHNWDMACFYKSSRYFGEAFPSYAHSYIIDAYDAQSIEHFLSWMNYNSYEKCGEDAEAEDAYEVRQKIKDLDDLEENIRRQTGENLQIDEAYLIYCTTTVEGSKDKIFLSDYYLFYETDGEWSMILVRDPEDFGL